VISEGETGIAAKERKEHKKKTNTEAHIDLPGREFDAEILVRDFVTFLPAFANSF